MSEPHSDQEKTPDPVQELVTKASAKAPTRKARSLFDVAVGGLGTKSTEQREKENQRERDLMKQAAQDEEDLRSEFKEAFGGPEDVEVETSAWKHAKGGSEENKTTIRLIAKLNLDDDEAVKKWLSRQDWADFSVTERNSALLNFSVYLDNDSDQHMSGVMRRRKRRTEASIVVKHIGPGARY